MKTANEIVKDGITNYFSIFPTRAHVLDHVFLTNGNGFDWNEEGDIIAFDGSIDLFQVEETNKNAFDHHVSRLNRLKDEMADMPEYYYKEVMAATAMHEMMSAFYSTHIDVIASTMNLTKFQPFLPEFTYENVSHFSTSYSLLSKAVQHKENNPDWSVNPIWKDAIKDIVNTATSLYYAQSAQYQNTDFDSKDVSHWHDGGDFKKYWFIKNSFFILFPEEVEIQNKRREATEKMLERINNRTK